MADAAKAVTAISLLCIISIFLINRHFCAKTLFKVEQEKGAEVRNYLCSKGFAKRAALHLIGGNYDSLVVQSAVNGGSALYNTPTLKALEDIRVCSRNSVGGSSLIKINYFHKDSTFAKDAVSIYLKSALAKFENSTIVSHIKVSRWAMDYNSLFMVVGGAIALLLLLFLLLASIRVIKLLRAGKLFKKSKKRVQKMVRSSAVIALMPKLSKSYPNWANRYNAIRCAEISAENIADVVAKQRAVYPEQGAALINVIATHKKDFDLTLISSPLESALINSLKPHKVLYLVCGVDFLPASPSYLHADLDSFLASANADYVIVVHPPIAKCKIPQNYLQSGALNLFICDYERGQDEATESFISSVPACKLLFYNTSLTVLKEDRIYKKALCRPKEKSLRKKSRELPYSNRNFIVVICNSYSDKHSVKFMEKWPEYFSYKIVTFAANAKRVVSNLKLSENEYSIVLVVKDGTTLPIGYVTDLAEAFDGGADYVTIPLKGSFITKFKTRYGIESPIGTLPFAFRSTELPEVKRFFSGV